MAWSWGSFKTEKLLEFQAAFERRREALDARRRGMKLKDIASGFGVSSERARQMICKAEREEASGRPEPKSFIRT